MARTLEVIQTEIKTAIRTYPSLDDYLFPEEGGSQVSVFNIIIYVVAFSMFTLETMIDIFTANIQAIADSAVSGNVAWVRQQILEFQFGDVVTITDFVPGYDPSNALANSQV